MEVRSELCKVCSNLDFHRSFQIGNALPDYGIPRPLGNLGRIQENRHCAFCRMVAHIAMAENLDIYFKQLEVSSENIICHLSFINFAFYGSLPHGRPRPFVELPSVLLIDGATWISYLHIESNYCLTMYQLKNLS
jgi:hypothetical protein